MQGDRLQEVRLRLYFDHNLLNRALRLGASLLRSQRDQQNAPCATVLGRRGFDVELFIQLGHPLQQLQRRLGGGHISELAHQHLLVLRHVHFDVVFVDVNFFRGRFDIIPSQTPGLLDIEMSGGNHGRRKSFDPGFLRERGLQVLGLLVPRLNVLHHFLDFLQDLEVYRRLIGLHRLSHGRNSAHEQHRNE